jgi:transmembrane sensor
MNSTGEVMTHDPQQFLVAERAALWCSQLPHADGSRRREFVRWLKQSPLHVREMLVAVALDLELGKYDPQRKIDLEALFTRATNNVTPLIPERRETAGESASAADDASDATVSTTENAAASEPATEAKPRSWKSSTWLIGIAAAASILALALSVPGIIKGVGLVDQYQTQTGEQRTIPLADGSVIHLNTQSNVRVAFSEETRDVYLEAGQATFDVAHDAARPFRVHVKHAVVQAIGTQFDVNLQTDHTDVAVTEGLVKVTAGKAASTATDVSAGKTIRIAADGSVSSPVDIKVADVGSWRSRRLVFRNNTLEQIAAEFNRYNKTPKIRVEGAILQSKRYSGIFDANDPESFLQYLAADQRLAFDRSIEVVVIRLRSSYALEASKAPADRKSAANNIPGNKGYPPSAITASP